MWNTLAHHNTQSYQEPCDIGLFEAIHTQRAIRYLRPDPVSDEVIWKLIKAATKAPSGTNRQPWKFIIIRDAYTKRLIGRYYQHIIPRLRRLAKEQPRIYESATYLAKHLHEAPVLILVCVENGGPSTLSKGSSIYPAVQNLLLAARGLGLGSVLTTFHKQYEHEIKDLLGIPDDVETAALLPVGYLDNRAQYGPTHRSPVEEVTYWEHWGSTN